MAVFLSEEWIAELARACQGSVGPLGVALLGQDFGDGAAAEGVVVLAGVTVN